MSFANQDVLYVRGGGNFVFRRENSNIPRAAFHQPFNAISQKDGWRK